MDAGQALRATGTETSEKPAIRALAIVDLVLALTVVVFLHRMLITSNTDITKFYGVWYQHILQHGRWHSIEGSYANYNPPYLYLLSLFSFLDGWVPAVVVLKLVEVPGVLAAGVIGWSIGRVVGASQRRAVLVGCLVALSPELIVNTLLWGQVDILYSVFLMLTLRLLLTRNWNWAMAMFGVALAIKLQAAIAGVTIAALLLAGELPLASVLWTLAAYIAMLAPARFAGRAIRDLAQIYRYQFSTQVYVAMNVANPYQLLNAWVGTSIPRTNLVNALGLLFTGACTLTAIYLLSRSPALLRGRGLIMAWALPLFAEPFILPKMHDRYFFPGNLMLVLLAGLDGRFVVPAVLTQAASLFVYHQFLTEQLFLPQYYIVPVCLMAVALWLFARALLHTARDGRSLQRLPNETLAR